MRYSSPHTVDISAEPVTPFPPSIARQRQYGSAVRQSLGVDVFLIFIALLMGVLFSTAVSAAIGTTELGDLLRMPPRGFAFVSCSVPAVGFLLWDTVSALSNPGALPFAKHKGQMKAAYSKRIHLMLLACYFTAILVALCWSAPSMLLFSKVFVSSVFSIALYALGQSIPSRRTSFIVSGILFLVVLVATQSFIVLTLEADSAREKQEVLNGVTPPKPGIDETPQEGVTQRRIVDTEGFFVNP